MWVAKKGYSLPSADRVISVLEFLAQTKRGFSVSEISRNLSLPKSSTFLILATLVHRGYCKRALNRASTTSASIW